MQTTIKCALVLIALLTTAAPLAAQSSKPQVGLSSWGYQLQNLNPAALTTVPYDAIVIDYSRDGSDASALTNSEVERLKFKPDGSRRVVLAYMSIGEAENYRYYWRSWWSDLWFIPNIISKPSWRAKLNGEWGGNYAVRYWEPAWQDIIVGNGGYLDRILKAGFDGVWLDKIDSSVEDVAKGRASAKSDMIDFIHAIAAKGRAARPGFLIFPQNGEALLQDAGYRRLIDGFGKEDLLYGEDGNGKPNTEASIAGKSAQLKQLVADGKPVLAVEYLNDRAEIDAARERIAGFGFVPHFADRELKSMRISDYPGGRVVAAKSESKSRSKEPSTYDTWKTRLLVAAAGVILFLGFMRQHR